MKSRKTSRKTDTPPLGGLKTVSDLAASFQIPRSRLLRAIKRGWLQSTIVKGRHHVSESALRLALGTRFEVERTGLEVASKTIRDLRIDQRTVNRFATTAAAEQLEGMLRRSALPGA